MRPMPHCSAVEEWMARSIELPDLNPPVELGELMDLAARFMKDQT